MNKILSYTVSKLGRFFMEHNVDVRQLDLLPINKHLF